MNRAMNSTMCISTDVELERYSDYTLSSLSRDAYATAPMAAVLPKTEPLDEEILHTSFEEAISERLVSLNSRLHRFSGPLPTDQTTAVVRSRSLQQQAAPAAPRGFIGWRRNVVFLSLALMFTMIGFDLMGLLVLHMH